MSVPRKVELHSYTIPSSPPFPCLVFSGWLQRGSLTFFSICSSCRVIHLASVPWQVIPATRSDSFWHIFMKDQWKHMETTWRLASGYILSSTCPEHRRMYADMIHIAIEVSGKSMKQSSLSDYYRRPLFLRQFWKYWHWFHISSICVT